MGRNKIEIKKLEPACQRRNTFSKRYKGLTKKVNELSTLCDIQVLLVTTSTSGGYRAHVGQNRSFSDVVRRYLSESKENLAEKKKETIEALRKSFRDGHVVNVDGMDPIEGEEDSERPLEETIQEIAEHEGFLGPLRNVNQLEKVESIEELLAMERALRYLIANNKKIKAHVLQQKNASIHHLSSSYLRDPRCSTSTAVPTLPAVPTVPVPSNHIGPLYGSSNPTGSMQQYGPIDGSGSNPTKSMQLHGLAVGSGSSPTGSMQQHGASVGSGSNPTGSMQHHGPRVGSGSNPTGSMQRHGHTVGSEIAWSHGPQNLSRNIPEMTDFQDSNSLLHHLKDNLSEGYDLDTFNGLHDLPNPNDANYGSLYDEKAQFEDWTQTTTREQ